MQFQPISEVREVPPPPRSHDPSTAELRAWLGELNRLKDEPGAPDEVRVRVLEHIELATVYLGLELGADDTASPEPESGTDPSLFKPMARATGDLRARGSRPSHRLGP